MRFKFLAFALSIALGILPFTDAWAQPIPPPGPALFSGAVPVPAGTNSARVALPSSSALYPALTIVNKGTVDASIALGGSTIVATTTGVCSVSGPSCPVPAGGSIVIPAGSNTYIAAITASGSTNLIVYQASGAVSYKTNGIGSGGGVVTSFNTRTGAVTLQAGDVSGVGGALLSGTSPFTARQTINLNAASAPAPIAGTILQAVGADAATGFIENDTFASGPIFTGRRADGTGVSPTAVQSAETLAGFSARPYDGTAYAAASTGNVQAVASENFSATNHGTDISVNCTAITTLTTAECGRFKSSGLTIPTGSTYQINGTQITTDALSNSANIALLNAANTFTNNQVVSAASFGLSGGQSASGIFGTNGIRYKNVAGTLTDTTSSGTIAANYDSKFGGNTLTATSATTITKNYGSYFVAPVCFTHVTCTNNSALGADSGSFGGAAQGTDALAVTGTATVSGNLFTNADFVLGTNGGRIDLRQGNTLLTSPATATLQFGGIDVDTAPVAQTLRVQGPLVGGTSNVAGPNWTFLGALGKGSSNSGDIIFQTGGAVGASGTTIATATTALTIKGVTNLVQLGAAASVANGTTVTTITSLGPTGTSCVIGDWFKLLDNGGSTRYVPMFSCT